MSDTQILIDLHHQTFDLESFGILMSQLFTDYLKREVAELFNLFDRDQDGLLNECESKFMYLWVERFCKLKFALIVIDMQNDFIDGALAIKNCPAKQDGVECVPVINRLIKTVAFDRLVYTLDWHPENHISFFKNVTNYQMVNGENKQMSVQLFDKVKFKIGDQIVEQILWPVHCVAGSVGAQLHKDLIVDEKRSFKILKGIASDCDSYSAFFDNLKVRKTELDDLLKQNEIDVLFISGLATDYCVGETTKDALKLGYSTILISDACKGIDKNSILRTEFELKNEGCLFISSIDVNSIVTRQIRLYDVGLRLAKKFVSLKSY